MKKIIIFIAPILLTVSCVKSVPFIDTWTKEQCKMAIERGYIEYDAGVLSSGIYHVRESTRLQLMRGPVVVVSKSTDANGVILRDGYGQYFTFRDDEWGSLIPGSVVKP